MEGDNFLDDDFLIEMLENLILEEFKEKDYTIYSQQISGLDLSTSAFQDTLKRIIETKSKSFNNKIELILRQNRLDILEEAFKRAQKKYKTRMTLRFMMSEQSEMGE